MENKILKNENLENEFDFNQAKAALSLENKGDYKMTHENKNELYSKISENSGFESFLSKGFENGFRSVFSLKNTQDFFADVSEFVNPLRKVSSELRTSSTAVNVPVISDNNGSVKNINIALVANTVKAKYGLQFIQNVNGYSDYIKREFAALLAVKERELFTDGYEEIKGLLQKDAHNLNVNDIEIIKADKDNLINTIVQEIYALDSTYRAGSCFMMSSKIQSQIFNSKDQTGNYLFKDNKLFGYEVHTLDEAKDSIVFGNFKMGYLIAEMQNINFSINPLPEDPAFMQLALPSFVGGAVLRPKAFKIIETK